LRECSLPPPSPSMRPNFRGTNLRERNRTRVDPVDVGREFIMAFPRSSVVALDEDRNLKRNQRNVVFVIV
jgi:hypothetical protein